MTLLVLALVAVAVFEAVVIGRLLFDLSAVERMADELVELVFEQSRDLETRSGGKESVA